MNRKAVFLDRDGTLNFDPGYLGDPDNVKLYPGVGEGIAELKRNGFKIIVISNQSGITRGLITEEQVKAVNEKINSILREENNTSIDAFYYCPFHPEFDDEEKTKCRKPRPDMVLRAAEENDVDVKRSFFIGDTVGDIECGKNAGCETIFVSNGSNKNELIKLHNKNIFPTFEAQNFLNACEFVLNFSGDE